MEKNFQNVTFYLHKNCFNSLELSLNFYDPELIDVTYNSENKEVVITSKEIIDLFEIVKAKILRVSICECVKYFFNLNLKNLKCEELKVNFDIEEEIFLSRFDFGINDRFLYINTFPENCKFLDLEVSSLYNFYLVNNKYLKELQITNNFFKCFNNSLLKIKDKQIRLTEDILFPNFIKKLQDENLSSHSLIEAKKGVIYLSYIYYFLKYNFKISFLRNPDKIGINYEYYKFKTLDKFIDNIYGIPIDKFVSKVNDSKKLKLEHSIEF
jgi:hypothetical protein